MVLDLVKAGVAGGHGLPPGILGYRHPQVRDGVGRIARLSVALRQAVDHVVSELAEGVR